MSHLENFTSKINLVSLRALLKELANRPNCMVLAVMSALDETNAVENHLLHLTRYFQEKPSKLDPEKEATNIIHLFKTVNREVTVEFTKVADINQITTIAERELSQGNYVFVGWGRSQDNPVPHIVNIYQRWGNDNSDWYSRGFTAYGINQQISDGDLIERMEAENGIIVYTVKPVRSQS